MYYRIRPIIELLENTFPGEEIEIYRELKGMEYQEKILYIKQKFLDRQMKEFPGLYKGEVTLNDSG